jgi:hypothetical protein
MLMFTVEKNVVGYESERLHSGATTTKADDYDRRRTTDFFQGTLQFHLYIL